MVEEPLGVDSYKRTMLTFNEFQNMLLPLIEQMEHLNQCQCEGVGDGGICTCGLDKIKVGIEQYSEHFLREL
jgi:hypothetical protein